MADLFDKQAAIYVNSRPTYPRKWFSMLSSLTPNHSLAWDVGTGNGQTAISVAEHYDKVIATDTSKEQLNLAIHNPRVQYVHTPSSMSDDEIISLLGGENSVDLITVSVAIHWFDLERFYAQVKRVLRQPGGIIAIWAYNTHKVIGEFDTLCKRYYNTAIPFIHPKLFCAHDGYKALPFPFKSMGLGSEGKPIVLDMPTEMSFDGMLGMLRSGSYFNTAKDQGVDLLPENFVKELEIAWGGSNVVRTVPLKASMIVGKLD